MTVEPGRRVAALSSPTRDELLDAYKAHIKHPPQHHNAPHPKKAEAAGENAIRAGQERGNYFTKFLAGQFGLNSEERPEDEQYLALQSKLLFEECCTCSPLLLGPIRTESGVLRLAEPNLPKILRILKNQANDGLDLLQPHGLAQYTVMHVAAQRGYTGLIGELITHWNSHPMNSPHQKYSFLLLSHLLELILQLRKTKGLASEANAEMRGLVAEVGVPFARFSNALDKLHDHAITLQDLLVICGHPLVLSKDAMGNTPLHYAAEGGHLSLCKLLINGGANINAQNKSGETPLHFAISSRRHGVCLYLVENHADVRMSRYVSLALMNGSVLRGTFVDSPEGSAIGKLMPSLHYPSGTMIQQQHLHVSDAKTHLPQYKISAGGSSPVSPDIHPNADRAHARHDAVGGASDTSGTTVDALLASPFLCTKNRRDIVFFRPAPGVSLFPPKLLCVLVISEHVTPSEMNKARELHEKGKLFHLLIQNVPAAAVAAMDSFRTPLFRCSMLKHIREHNQRWIVDSKLKTPQEKHEALLVQMKGQANTGRSPKRRRRRGPIRRAFDRVWASVMELWAFLRRVRSVLSVQHVFAATDAEAAHKESIVCEPKGILYEYVYDHAEFRGHLSPTLWLIIQVRKTAS
ncbi:hypothetical protein BBJ28_00000194 [Nothophytophthora sp. Chile5]|nr:hypothetical protein BBJ28_00000194 [Nothophytophthora sp. Chile5]